VKHLFAYGYLALAPDIPTFGEMGLPAVSWSEWSGLFPPKTTPKDVVGRLNAAVMEALADPAVRSRLAELGYEGFPTRATIPDSLGAPVKADAAKWWPLIKEFGIKPD
jgi:tripartite-type tricarboxylate transporter receptor subunit TctC